MSVEVGTHAVGSSMGTDRRVVISHKPKFSIQRLDQHNVAHKVRSRQEHSILATGSSQAGSWARNWKRNTKVQYSASFRLFLGSSTTPWNKFLRNYVNPYAILLWFHKVRTENVSCYKKCELPIYLDPPLQILCKTLGNSWSNCSITFKVLPIKHLKSRASIIFRNYKTRIYS